MKCLEFRPKHPAFGVQGGHPQSCLDRKRLVLGEDGGPAVALFDGGAGVQFVRVPTKEGLPDLIVLRFGFLEPQDVGGETVDLVLKPLLDDGS